MTRTRCNYAANNVHFVGIIGKTSRNACTPLDGQWRTMGYRYERPWSNIEIARRKSGLIRVLLSNRRRWEERLCWNRIVQLNNGAVILLRKKSFPFSQLKYALEKEKEKNILSRSISERIPVRLTTTKRDVINDSMRRCSRIIVPAMFWY